ncbi:MAG: Mrp/NBP35 family ATP-binding protein [Vicinamibacterales bacterium]
MLGLTDAAVLDALKSVRDPDVDRDIVSLGFVKDVRIADASVALTLQLTTPACPFKERLRDETVAVLRRLGASHVDVTLTAVVRPGGGGGEIGRAPIPGVKNVIAVGAGKGGVGKTTTAVNLAVSLSQFGARVGLLDADLYGPNVPIMLGIKTQLQTDGKRILPAEKFGLQIVSIGFLASDDSPIIWRGPLLHGAIRQFFHEVAWDDLDYLVVDMPPGTGDIALSLSQTVGVAGAVLVTTPQSVSVADTRRAVAMYQKLQVPVAGLVENMSHFACPSCGHESDIFGKGGGERLAEELNVRFLGRIPIYEPIRSGGDLGVPIVIGEPESPAARALRSAAQQVAAQVAIGSFKKKAIPLTVVR